MTQRDANVADAPQLSLHRSYFLDREFFDRAYGTATNGPMESKVFGGIVSHHLLASHLMADFYQRLEQNNQPDVVVVIGPNHMNLGDATIAVSRGEWDTPYGTLKPNLGIVDDLARTKSVVVDERVFATEHSISAEVAFIKKSFPKATIVPVVLKTIVPNNRMADLATELNRVLPDRSLVIASVDFAHYVTSAVADSHDQQTLKTLEQFDIDGIATMDVDSRPTMEVFMRYLDARNARHAVLLENTNSAKVIGNLSIPQVTSYFMMYFTR